MSVNTAAPPAIMDQRDMLPPPAIATQILVNGEPNQVPPTPQTAAPNANLHESSQPIPLSAPQQMDQSAAFFDPDNVKAFQLREQVALETLDELLDYVLNGGGSVGILDATNSTLERRKMIMNHIRKRAGSE